MGKRQTLTFPTTQGPQEFACTVYGQYATHRSRGSHGEPQGYTVTHIPSGCTLIQGEKLTKVRAIVARCEKIDAPFATPQDCPRETMDALIRAVYPERFA